MAVTIQQLLVTLQTNMKPTLTAEQFIIKLYNLVKARFEDLIKDSDFPSCEIEDPTSLLGLKSEIDRLCLASLPVLKTPADRSYAEAAYLMVNYKLDVTMDKAKKTKYVANPKSLPTAEFILQLMNKYSLSDPKLQPLLNMCEQIIMKHGDPLKVL